CRGYISGLYRCMVLAHLAASLYPESRRTQSCTKDLILKRFLRVPSCPSWSNPDTAGNLVSWLKSSLTMLRPIISQSQSLGELIINLQVREATRFGRNRQLLTRD